MPLDPNQDQSLTDYLMEQAKKGFGAAKNFMAPAIQNPGKTAQSLLGASGIPVVSDLANAKSITDSMSAPKPPTDPMANAFAQEDYQSAAYKPPFGNEFQPPVPPAPVAGAPGAGGPASPDPRVVSSAPGHSADDLGAYLKQQRAQLDKYGPDHEKAVMDNIAQQQGSLKGVIGDKMAQASDDIMQGVARAGSGQAMSRRIQQKQNAVENARGLAKDLDESNQKHVAENQSLDQMDHNSPIGGAMLSTYGPLLDKLGIPKDKQAQMVPALISTMAPELIKHEDAMAKIMEAKNHRSELDAFKQSNVDQGNWIKLTDRVNALNAGSRKALGVAASSNMRADRVLETLDNPDIVKSPQSIYGIVADIAGIYKGGSPDEVSLKHSMFPTLEQDIARAKGYLSGNPEPAATAALIKQFREVTQGLKQVDNKVIEDNLGVNAVGFEPLIKKDPERWARMTGAVMHTTVPTSEQPAQGGGPAPAQGAKAPYGDTVEKNGKTYRWNSTTGKYHPE